MILKIHNIQKYTIYQKYVSNREREREMGGGREIEIEKERERERELLILLWPSITRRCDQ